MCRVVVVDEKERYPEVGESGGIYTFPGNLFVSLFDEYSLFDLRVCLFSLLIAFSGRDAVSRLH